MVVVPPEGHRAGLTQCQVQFRRPSLPGLLPHRLAIHHPIRARLSSWHVLANTPDVAVEMRWVSSGSWVAVHVTDAQPRRTQMAECGLPGELGTPVATDASNTQLLKVLFLWRNPEEIFIMRVGQFCFSLFSLQTKQEMPIFQASCLSADWVYTWSPCFLLPETDQGYPMPALLDPLCFLPSPCLVLSWEAVCLFPQLTFPSASCIAWFPEGPKSLSAAWTRSHFPVFRC